MDVIWFVALTSYLWRLLAIVFLYLGANNYSSGLPRLLESPGFFLKFPGLGKSWNLPVIQLTQHAFYV